MTPWLPLQSPAQCTPHAQLLALNASSEVQETLLLVLVQKGQNHSQSLTVWIAAAAVYLVRGHLLAAAGQWLHPVLLLLPLLLQSWWV